MLRAIAVLASSLLLIAPAVAAPVPPRANEFTSLQAVQKFLYEYRAKPTPARVPAAVHALGQLGNLKDPEGSGIYLGFIAGAIGSNPRKADELINKMLPLT